MIFHSFSCMYIYMHTYSIACAHISLICRLAEIHTHTVVVLCCWTSISMAEINIFFCFLFNKKARNYLSFQMYKLGLEKAQESEIKLPTSVGSWRKQGNSREKKHLFMLHWLKKPLTVWITTNCGWFLKRWEYQAILPFSWETCLWVKKQ